MGASPKSKRAAPERRFEDYVLTYEVGPNAGLYPIPSSQMKFIPGPVGMSGNYGELDEERTAGLKLGFEFSMDGQFYDDLEVCINGWCCLLDRNVAYVNEDGGAVQGLPAWAAVGSAYSFQINSEFVGDAKHAVLAPWFTSMATTHETLDGPGWELGPFPYNPYTNPYSALGTIAIACTLGVPQDYPEWNDYEDSNLVMLGPHGQALDILSRMKKGKIKHHPGMSGDGGGVRYHRGQSSSDGKFLLIRWRNFSWSSVVGGLINPIRVITFDVVIFESGRIEFRYTPRASGNKDNYFPGIDDNSYENAACGIFVNGKSDFPRYRDFGGILKPDSRGVIANGGSVYDGVFTDNWGVGISPWPYTVSLVSSKTWPGLKEFGAVFRFSPPQNRRTNKKSIVTLRDATSFTERSTSFFDDRLSIPFGTQSVEYPTMFPTSIRTTSNVSDPSAIQELYQSGSITVNRTITPGLFDSILSDSLIEGQFKRGGK